MLIIQILILIFAFNAIKYALKQRKSSSKQEQKSYELHVKQNASKSVKLVKLSVRLLLSVKLKSKRLVKKQKFVSKKLVNKSLFASF